MARHANMITALACLVLTALPFAHGARLIYSSAKAVAADDRDVPVTPKGNGTQVRRVLQNGPQQSLADNMQNLMNAVCRYQSGSDCGEIDWSGSTDWYRGYFVTLPSTSINTGLNPPNVPRENQYQQDQPISSFSCPYRPIAYACRLDKQYFEQVVHTTTHSSGWNVGSSIKASAIFGVDIGIAGLQTGVTAQFSFSYSFQDATAEAHTDQMATVERVDIKIDPASYQCALITTHLSVTKATGTQEAYISVTGWVGTNQGDNHHWLWDSDPNEEHHIRAMTFAYVVQQAQQAGLPEASQWTVNGDEARIVLPFDLDISFGTSGYSTTDWDYQGSDRCNQWSPPAQGLTQGLTQGLASLGREVVDQEGDLPVIMASQVWV